MSHIPGVEQVLDQPLMVNDQILEVNGETDAEHMLRELFNKTLSYCHLRIRRCHQKRRHEVPVKLSCQLTATMLNSNTSGGMHYFLRATHMTHEANHKLAIWPSPQAR